MPPLRKREKDNNRNEHITSRPEQRPPRLETRRKHDTNTCSTRGISSNPNVTYSSILDTQGKDYSSHQQQRERA